MTQRKSWIATLVMVGLAAALAAFIFLVEAEREPPPDRDAPPEPVPLWEFGAGGLTRIAVTRGGEQVALERTDEGWWLAAPERTEADALRVGGLAYQLSTVGYTSAFEDVEQVAQYGLEAPDLAVTLVLTDGTTIRLNVGDENPGRDARYVQKEGDGTVYLVPSYSLGDLIGLIDDPPYAPTPTPVLLVPPTP